MDFSTSATINFTGLTNFLNLPPSGIMADGISDMLAIDTKLLSDLADDSSLDSLLLADFSAEKMPVELRESDLSLSTNASLNENSKEGAPWGAGLSPAEPSYVGESDYFVAITNGPMELYVHADLFGGDVL
jgi:hypothetical protein